MRALQITRFGGPEVLDVVELPDPVPWDGEQLFDVQAAGINFADTHHPLSRDAPQRRAQLTVLRLTGRCTLPCRYRIAPGSLHAAPECSEAICRWAVRDGRERPRALGSTLEQRDQVICCPPARAQTVAARRCGVMRFGR
jgi:hypothetical protein